MAEENKFLEIVNLKKGYGSGETRQEVLRGMTFSVARGEICVLLGPSGSGKSTLLNIIGGIDSADAGFISIGGDKLEDMGEKALTQYRRKHLGYVFQLYNLIANLNVKENIEVGAYLSDAPLDIDELLHTLGLYEHRHKLPNQLSGGQQQRVSIGRAIVKNPDILRRADRRAGLCHVQGDPAADRKRQQKVRQHRHHGHAQRGHPQHGRPRHQAARRHRAQQREQQPQDSGRRARVVRGVTG